MVVFLTLEKFGGRAVSKIAGGKDVRNGSASQARNAAALGQVRFNEGAVAAAEFAERMQSFDDSRALRPAAARTGGERDHGDFAASERFEAELVELIRCRPCRPSALTGRWEPRNVIGSNVLKKGTGGQPILCEANPALFEIGADLFVLDPIKTVLLEQYGQRLMAG